MYGFGRVGVGFRFRSLGDGSFIGRGDFAEFRKRYVAELEAQGDGLDKLRAAVKGQPVTLLTATKEIDLSHATVLRDLLGASA